MLDKAVLTTLTMCSLLVCPCTILHDLGRIVVVLVQAATGEDVSAEDLGGAELHCTTSGVVITHTCHTTVKQLGHGWYADCATCQGGPSNCSA